MPAREGKFLSVVLAKGGGVMKPCAPNNCPINERTGDGAVVGRCWFALKDGICPRHGDVREAVKHYLETGQLTLEARKAVAS